MNPSSVVTLSGKDALFFRLEFTMPSEYTAANIRILPESEVVDRWDWAKAGALAHTYGVPEHWVARGLEACARAGVSSGHFIRRYLKQESDEPLHEGVNEAMRDLMREARDERWGLTLETGNAERADTPSPTY